MSILDAQHDLSAFRQAIRKWLAEVVPPDWKARMARASNEEYIAFQRWWMAERSKVGLAIPHWPRGVRRRWPFATPPDRHRR